MWMCNGPAFETYVLRADHAVRQLGGRGAAVVVTFQALHLKTFATKAIALAAAF